MLQYRFCVGMVAEGREKCQRGASLYQQARGQGLRPAPAGEKESPCVF